MKFNYVREFMNLIGPPVEPEEEEVMNHKAILSTAVCFWNSEDKCFVVESPLTSITAGADSEVEAKRKKK